MNGAQFKALLPDLLAWARGQMVRPHDFMIGGEYLRRWWIIPRNDYCNIYLHEFTGGDDDRALHDHPWPSTSFILDGSYIEHTPEGTFLRQAGDVISREADALHRIELPPEYGKPHPVISLFITGPKVREWGFACEHGWVHWSHFTDPNNPGGVGRGCGEHGDLTPVTSIGMPPRILESDGTVG